MTTKDEFGAHVKHFFKTVPLPPLLGHLVHALLGVGGELSEFSVAKAAFGDVRSDDDATAEEWDRVKADLAKEGGDVLFYCEAATQALVGLWGEINDLATRPTTVGPVDHMAATIALGVALDIAKKAWAQGRAMTEAEIWKSLQAIAAVQRFVEWGCYDAVELVAEQLRRTNVVKLQARFPSGGFPPAEAMVQIDKVAPAPVPQRVPPRMSIYCPAGTHVVFDGEGGYDHQIEEASKVLVNGLQYQVEHVEVGRSSSSVKLQGVPGWFNTVMFGRVDKK